MDMDSLNNAVVSPYEEFIAYEYLYTLYGSSKTKMSSTLGLYGGRPTVALRQGIGLTVDDPELKMVDKYVSARGGGFSLLVEGMDQFPAMLCADRNHLPILYYRGDLSLLESPCVSVVGARNPSERGSLAARRIATALTKRRITVVVGLARGIDTHVMSEAISRGGHVIGVIGTPIDRCYPQENRDLQEEMARRHLLISQVPLYHYDHQEFRSRAVYFRERNETMAALSQATVIVEAGERSGTRVQARACVEQGKTLVFLPDVVETTSWAKGFVERGAHVASSVSELMTLLG